jgi:hypothetical protein
MHFDFWNNPIVVSAFRVRYRRGGFTGSLAPYLVTLAAIGAGLEYYQNKLQYPWARIYYPILMGLQFWVLGFIACTATSASMRSEVVNRTWDFQRIAALSPRQILWGKLLGEPAIAYLMAMASFPLAMWCVMAGGISLEIMLLMYVNLATTMLLCGAAGLISGFKSPAGQVGGVFLSVCALACPIPLFVGISHMNPWSVAIPFFGIPIPCLLLFPPAQLLLAFICFRIMERQLVTPLNPLISKPMAYGILAAVDLAAAALIYDLGRGRKMLATEGVVFCMIHFTASFLLTLAVTSWRETLHSWVWRFRRRQPLISDLWLGDRSENILVLVTFAVIGLVNLAIFVGLPAVLSNPNDWDENRVSLSILIASGVTTAAWILTIGTAHQWLSLILGRMADPATFFLAAMAALGPLAGAIYKQSEWICSFSPLMHFAQWLTQDMPGSGGPQPAFSHLVLVFFYLLLFILFWYLLRTRMRKLEASVDFKLRLMGALDQEPRTK